MASPATIPMFDPHGQLGDVPAERIWDTVQAGGKIAIPAIAPDGVSKGYIPHDRLARAKGARVDINDPETQSIFSAMKDASPPSPSVGDTVLKSFGLGNLVKNGIQGLKEMAGGIGEMVFDPRQAAIDAALAGVDQADKAKQDFARKDTKGKISGAGHALAAALPLVGPYAASLGEQAGTGDVGGAAAKAGSQALAGEAAGLAAKGAGSVKGMVEKPAYFMSADELASTTPKRIAELKAMPDKVAAVQKLAVDTEAKAKAAAKAAYPEVETPITRTHVDASGQVVQEQVPFRQVQEEYSRVSQQWAVEKRAAARGAAPAYDLQKLTEKRDELAAEMRDAAAKDGKLDDLINAQRQWKQYMDDFHNGSSPVRPLLETAPDQTAKIANHLLNADKGARTIEVLERNGADVSGARGLLSKGSVPLKVDVAESAKLRKAGSDSSYTQQRYQEALDQATTNRLPAGAEAKIPAKAMSGRSPLAIPGTKIGLPAPRTVTRYKLRQALSGK